MEKPRVGSIAILSGPVGAGKTTVARELLALATGPTVYIEGDTFWSFIVAPDKRQPPPKSFTMIMRAMLAAARHYERDGYDVLVDFSIPPWYLDGVRALLKGVDVSYLVMRPSEDVCAARAATRPDGTIADYGPYRELYRSFENAGRYVVCDDEGEPAEVAARIRAGIETGTFRIF